MVKALEVANIQDLTAGVAFKDDSHMTFVTNLAQIISDTGYTPQIYVLGTLVFPQEVIHALLVLRQRWMNMEEDTAPPRQVAVMNGKWFIPINRVDVDGGLVIDDDIHVFGDHVDTDKESNFMRLFRRERK